MVSFKDKTKQSNKELKIAEIAKHAADKVMKRTDAFASEKAFRKALKEEFENAGLSDKQAQEFAKIVDIGLAFEGEKDPLKELSPKRVMTLNLLRQNLMDKVIESFVPIFGQDIGKEKAEEFMLLLLGSEDADESEEINRRALIYQISDQIKKMVKRYGDNPPPEILENYVKEALVETISKNARTDLDSFVLNEALMANGKRLLNVFHDALVGNSGGGSEDIELPFYLKI